MTRIDALAAGRVQNQAQLEGDIKSRIDDALMSLEDLVSRLNTARQEVTRLEKKANRSPAEDMRLEAKRAEVSALEGKQKHLETVRDGLQAEQHAVSDGVITKQESEGLAALKQAVGSSERTVADMQKNADTIRDIASRADPSLKAEISANRAVPPQAPLRYTNGPSIEQLDQGAPLKMGMKGESVRWLQEQLNAAGAEPPLVVDGKMGPKTTAALKEFQASRGVAGDNGVFAAATREAFDKETLMDPVQWKEVHKDALASGRTSLGNADVNEGNLRRTQNESFRPYEGTIQNGVKPMSQGDYNVRIGNSGKTIRQVGCMMTSFAMASTAITGNKDMNPARANDLIKSRGGFVGASLSTDRAANALGMRMVGRIGTHNSSPQQLQNRIDQSLQAGRPCVLGVDYRKGSGGTGNGTGVDHWVTITGKNADGSYNCVDPAGGRTFTLRPGRNGLLEGNSPLGNKHYVAKEAVLLDRAR
jgi:peptidoglycan hydrolase-like protein with peptidoglycan-binding domain